MNYTGQIFGNRKVIRDYCNNEDWTKLNLKIPKRTKDYKLTKCLNCGAILPSLLKNLICQPPKRCVFCSNIGNHSAVETKVNSWTLYDNYAVCNIFNSKNVISFYIDIDDYELAKKYIWRISKKKRKYYIVTGSFKKNTAKYLHELVYGEHQQGYEIDHIDGNSLNNRKENLRLVSHQENVDNIRATRIDNQIGIRGIAYDKRGKCYVVDFNYHGKRYYTKRWKTLPEAVWCRYCFEDYFNIPAIKRNPLAEEYFILPESKRNEIQEYVLNIILGNKR